MHIFAKVINNGNHLYARGYDDRFQKLGINFLELDNLWTNDYFLCEYGYKIYVYNVYTIKLEQVICIPRIGSIRQIVSNNHTTAFICLSYENTYSIIQRLN